MDQDGASLEGLSSLTTVGDGFTAERSTPTNLVGLSNITTVTDQVIFEHGNAFLTRLDGLDGVTTMGRLSIRLVSDGDIPSVRSDISALSNLTTVRESLSIRDLPINDFSGLSSLTTVGGNVSFSH